MQSSVMHPAILSYLIETVCCKIHSLDHCGRRLNRGAVVSRSFSSFRQVILLKDMATLERADGGKFGRCGKSCGVGIRNNLLLVLLITAAVVGLVIGVLVNPPVNPANKRPRKEGFNNHALVLSGRTVAKYAANDHPSTGHSQSHYSRSRTERYRSG